MPNPPTYADLGKQSRDIFNKGYHFGLLKLECKTKSTSGMDFTVSGSSNQDTGKVSGALETKYKVRDCGLTLTEKWNTDNTLATELTVEDQLAKGLKLTFESTFAPQTGNKNGRIKTAYKMDVVHLNADVDLDMNSPTFHGSAVIGYNNWLAGYQASFDSAKSKLTRSNFAVGYAVGDFVLHTNLNDGQEFSGSVYQKVNEELETGVQVSWTALSVATRFGLGCKYRLDKDSSVSAKVNNSSQIGVGYTQKLRPGITLTLSALVEGKNFNQGGHKLGVGLDLEA